MSSTAAVRVRIAPSPTGNLHVGTARTALFNYLFAKHTGGQFMLRIEDTDLERSEDQYTQNIYQGLQALGLTWDEGPNVGGDYGPYKQSERLALYQQYADQLLAEGKAYYCYKTAEELDAEREQAEQEKRAYVYQRPNYSAEDIEAFKADETRKPSLRFKLPDDVKTVVIHDLIRGEIKFETELIGDFVIMKSNGTPTYNFACVVDDLTMAISHIIRGEDHIPNTPKQILLFEALKAPLPAFAHVGMILAPDRTKLSKRQGATGIAEFISQGYLPEALCNFLSLLGWAPPDGQEIGSLEHFAQLFDITRVAHSPAVFDKDKLNFLNSHYMRHMPLDDFEAAVQPYLTQIPWSQYSAEKRQLILQSVREPMVLLSDITEAVSYFFAPPSSLSDDAKQTLEEDPARTAQILNAFEAQVLSQPQVFESVEAVGAAVKPFAKGLDPLKMKTVMWTLRAAITGRVTGADLSNTLYILGAEEITKRLQQLKVTN